MIKTLLLLFGFLKFGKLLTIGGAMLLSLAVYASICGWRYAAGFVALLFIHEMGHFIAARRRGLAALKSARPPSSPLSGPRSS